MKQYLSIILREPLAQFILIGVVVALVFQAVIGRIDSSKEQIVVTQIQIQQLAAQFTRTWMRPPTEAELTNLIRSHVRDEIYYREALAMGLNKDDRVIRQRMRQKLELLMDEVSSLRIPSDAELTRYLQSNSDRYRIDPRISFVQVYLNTDEHKDIKADAARILTQLRAGADPATVGDRAILGYRFERESKREIARTFGEQLAEQVVKIEPGSWVGPIYSTLGAHLVFVSEHIEGRLPELSEVRAEVERDWRAEQRQKDRDAVFEELLDEYDVVIQQPESTSEIESQKTPEAVG
jgi:hypothetical protein